MTVDATLARGRAITGTVTGVGGPVDTASVAFYQLQPGGSYSFVDSDNTDADGVYRGYLPAGTYKVNISAYDNRVSEWWNNAATQAAASTVVPRDGVRRHRGRRGPRRCRHRHGHASPSRSDSPAGTTGS